RAGRAARLPQHERRVRGGGPGRRAAPGPPGGREAGGRARPPDRRRPHDHGRVDARSQAPVRQGGQSMSKIDGLPPEVQEEVTATAAAPGADIAVAPELMANSLSEYLR